MTLLRIKGRKPEQWTIADWRWVLAQACREGKPSEEDLEVVQKMLEEFIRRGDPTFHFETYSDCAKRIVTDTLMKIADSGMYLVPPHGEMLYDGKKSAVVKSRKFDRLTQKFHFLVSGKKVYGLLRFADAEEIDIDAFERLKGTHRISDNEREAWWPNARKLYYYPLRDFLRFENVLDIKTPQGVQTFLKNVKKYFDEAFYPGSDEEDLAVLDFLPDEEKKELETFILEDREELLSHSVAEAPIELEPLVADLKKITRLELISRHAKIHSIAESYIRKDEKIPEDIANAHALIIAEMKRRGMEHRIETAIDYDSPNLKSEPNIKLRALGTRGNVQEWSSAHKRFTGVELDVNGKILLLDCGDRDFLKVDPAFVLISHFHPDHFAWFDIPAAQEKEPGVLELQRSPSTIGASKMYLFIQRVELPEHKTYVEPFAGTGRFLFHKEPSAKEVLNDLNEDGMFVLNFVKNMTAAQYKWLMRQKWTFDEKYRQKLIKELRSGKFRSKAHRFYIIKYLMRTSMLWRDGGPSGPRYTAKDYDGADIREGKDRLKNVIITVGDYKSAIEKYDSPETLFLIDPPYRQTPKAWYKHDEKGMDWEEFYSIVKGIKGKWLVLQSDGKKDREILKKLSIGFKIARFPTKSVFGKKHQSSATRRKFICATNFPLKLKAQKKGKLDEEEELLLELLDPEEIETDEIPQNIFVAAPRSKNEVSKKAEKAGFEMEWTDEYEWGPFKCKAFPIEHSKLAPTVAWKIRAAGKTIIFMPDVRDFDQEILKDVDIYIGDGASFTRDITRQKGVGHMSIKHQLERAQEAGIKDIFFIHCGKEIIENKELEGETEELGGKILHDNDTRALSVDLVHLADVLAALPSAFYTQDKYFIAGSTAVSGRGYDIDILERGDKDRAARFRILQSLRHLADRVSFVSSQEGPFTSYVPLYRKGYTRIESDQIVMSQEAPQFEFLALEGPALRDAQASRNQDKIHMGRFFALQKTHAGYHKRESFDPKEAISEGMVREAKFPYAGEEKKDGFHIEAHWDGSNLTLFSEDGKEQHLSQAPELEKAFHGKRPFIGAGELEAWIPKVAAVQAGLVPKEREAREGKVHLGRGDVTGYMHSKKYNPLVAKNLVLNIYDVLWTREDEELYKKPLSERIKVRDSILPRKGLLVAIETTELKSGQDVLNFWKKIAHLPSSEGIMLKPLEDRYVLWHTGGLWVKVKSLHELSCKVLKVEQGQTKAGKPLNVWRASCGLRQDGKTVYVGTTYHSKERISPGDIIEVRFQNISKYVDPRTGEVWFNWWRPTIVSKRPEKKEADSTEIAERLVRATNGEIGEKSLPRVAKEALGKLEIFDLTIEETRAYLNDLYGHVDCGEDFVEIEKEPPMPDDWEQRIKRAQSYTRDKIYASSPTSFPAGFFVIQSHWRGKSLHLDFRQKMNEHLEGDTWLAQVEGAIDEPVTTIDQARQISRKFHSSTASTYIKVYPNMDYKSGWMIGPKETQPLGWIKAVKTIVPPGEVGSTKEFPGVFWGEDWGLAITTVKKPWFEERFLYSKWFGPVRYIKRLLPTRPGYVRAGKKGVFWRAHFSDPKSPPYIFSPAFFKNTEWIPEDSALPPNWEAAIPEKLRWWGKGLPPKQRLALIKASFNYLVEENFLRGRKKLLDKDEFDSILSDEQYPYVLHRIWWRGPAHVRYTAISKWILRIATDRGMETFEFEGNPTREATVGHAALRSVSSTKPPGGESPKDWLKFEGTLPAKHPENPNKKLEAQAVIIDKGKFRKVADSEDFLSGRFNGKQLKGYFIFKREEPGSDVWLFKREAREAVRV